MERLVDINDVMEMLTNVELSCTCIPITEAKTRLAEISTAYDVSKVVERLKCAKEDYWEGVSERNMAINDAIEIVKGGGIDAK